MEEANGIVSVKLNGPVGSFTAYSKMVVAVRSTMDGVSTFGKAILQSQRSQGRECGTPRLLGDR